METSSLLSYFQTVFGQTASQTTRLFSVQGIASILCFALLKGQPSQSDMQSLLSGAYNTNEAVYYTILFGLLLGMSFLKNPCSPLYQTALTFSIFFSEQTVMFILNRLYLFPWESGLVNAICYTVLSFVYKKNISAKDVMLRFFQATLGQMIGKIGAFVVDQTISQEKLSYFVLSGFMIAKKYAEDVKANGPELINKGKEYIKNKTKKE
ncbi:Hypothetical_protein [Hexamita inflata]|uniref:Hypothetical_protein n=1 Tax=Hexamita inflata TaxID=28002 RepID=A0ABP1J4U4_9EUKA